MGPSTARGLALTVALVLTAATTAACSADSTQSGRSAATPAPQSTLTAQTTQAPPTTEEDTVDIRITVDGQPFGATLVDSPAARDLVAQLPATIEMRDHGGVEKTGRLASPLSLEGQPEGAEPDVGDVGYYAPGQDLVLYYGDQSFFPGIVVLGRLDGDAAARIADVDGSVTVVVENR